MKFFKNLLDFLFKKKISNVSFENEDVEVEENNQVPPTNVEVVPVYAILEKYQPFSEDARKLFREACRVANLPIEWADIDAPHEILKRESAGWVGRPNYTFQRLSAYPNNVSSPSQKEVWPIIWEDLKTGYQNRAVSSATGLGQLLLSNAEKYYPSGKHGIGDPLEEAVGFFMYMKDRYLNPTNALAFYNLPIKRPGDEGYARVPYSWRALEYGFKNGEGYLVLPLNMFPSFSILNRFNGRHRNVIIMCYFFLLSFILSYS